MCSATQTGLRRRRSKEDTREARVARSATGPGNPYWKSPAGSTGASRASALVVVVVAVVVGFVAGPCRVVLLFEAVDVLVVTVVV